MEGDRCGETTRRVSEHGYVHTYGREGGRYKYTYIYDVHI
jgi:hypothetical protein